MIYDGSLRALISIVLLAACSSTEKVRVDLPIGSEHRSLVLAVEDGGELSVYAFDLERDGPILQTLIPSYIGSYEVNLTAFLYSRELDALGFQAGTVLPANSDPVRPIPSATSTMAATVRGEDVTEWKPIARPSEAVMSFRVPGLANEECVERGGCFGATSAACIVPCPEVAAPAAAEMPAIPTASCAPGWSDLEVKPGVAVCTPWPGAPPACNGDETIFPGESSCHALGPGCPAAGAWPTALPAGPRVYVRAGATGGDGSENAPLGAIQAAIGQAAAGAVIVIGAGAYPEEVRINKSVTLFGACPEQTTIDAPGVAIVAAAPNASVQNLRITATDDGVHFETGSLLRIADVIIENTGGEGVAMFNASTAELERVLIRHTDDTGIWVQGRGVVNGSRVHIYNARGGVGADRSRMTLVDSVIRDSRPNADGDFGRGANVQNDATAIFRRTMFDNHHDIGIFVSTANAELDRVVIQRTKVRPIDDGAGFGLLVQNEGVATIRNSWLDENHDSNLYNFNGVATFEDSVLSHARVTPNGDGGFNVHNIADGSVTLRRVVAVDSEFNNINLSNSRFAQFEDVSVLGAGIKPNRDSGNGIDIHGTASPVLARVYIADVAAKALDIGDASSSANLSDITIRRAGSGDCFFCSGLCLANGAQVTNAERIDISDVLGVGVYTQDQGTKLIISDITVTKTKRSAACVLNHNVRDVGHGVGIYSADGATIEGRNFLSAENEESGVEVAEFLPTSMDTALDLSSGTIRDNAIGATVLIEGYDTRRIAKFVVFSNNDTNLNYGQ